MTGRHVVLMRRFDALETLRLVEARAASTPPLHTSASHLIFAPHQTTPLPTRCTPSSTSRSCQP